MPYKDSYDRHNEWYNKHFPSEESKIEMYRKVRLVGKDNVASWLQDIFFSCLDPLLQEKNKNWLTVGDAYGFDAQHILNSDNQVLATDLNTDFLNVALKEAVVSACEAENAEKMTFKDESFDYVLCKESYHHFPRPYIALYEMLRVAKKGIIIIEPQDPISKIPLLLGIVNILSKFNPSIIKKVWKNQFSFEPVGNFVYKVSEREFEKVSAGLGLRMVAFKQINPNFYKKNIEKLKPTFRNGKFRSIWFKKAIFDIMTKCTLFPGQVLSTIIFKQLPTEIEIKQLKKSGYKIVRIPINPYT